MNIPLRLSLIVIVASQATGCAFGTRFVDLSYPPKNVSEQASEAATASMRFRELPSDIVLEVYDKRDQMERIGNIRNGYGIDTASILTEQNIAVWVHDAIDYELDRLGIAVIEVYDADFDEPPAKLVVDVKKVYCDIYAMYDGEVALQADLVQGHDVLMSAAVEEKAVSGLSFVGSGSSTGESLAQALQMAIQELLLELGLFSIDPQAALPSRL